MSSVKEFHVLLFELAECLSKNDIEGITLIEELPAEFQEQSALKVLLKLKMMGKIDESNPSTLEEVFKSIKRIDLAKKVKEFSKSQKRHKKGSPQKTLSVAIEGLELSLRANLEVTVSQLRLFRDQLKHLQEIAELTASNKVQTLISDVRVASEQVDKKLLQVKDVLLSKEDQFSESVESESNFQPSGLPVQPSALQRRKSSFNKELQHSLQARTHTRTPKDCETSPKGSSGKNLRREAKKPLPEAQPESALYAEVRRGSKLCIKDAEGSLFGKFSGDTPNSSHGQAEPSSALVTGALHSSAKKKPILPPKPQKTKFEEYHDDDEDDTTGTTGDSGFADASPFLKIPLKSSRLPSPPTDDDTMLPSIHDRSLSSTVDTLNPQSPPGYYKSICKERVAGVSYYKVADRESELQKWQDIATGGTPRTKDNRIYENSSNTF